jgi:hypothetical protein
MKRAVIGCLCGAILLGLCGGFGGCFFARSLKTTVTYSEREYKTGFYGELYFPVDIDFGGEEFELDGRTFYTLPLEGHHWIYTFTGAQRVVYCLSEEWEQENAYYSDNDNFDFYCSMGNVYEPLTVAEIPNMDYDKFEELGTFADEHGYDPFNAKADKGQKAYPMPDWRDGEIRFYKVSKDGLFSSTKGNNLHLIDGRLVLLYRYYFADDEAQECMYGVELPSELSDYFIGILQTIDTDEKNTDETDDTGGIEKS